MSVIIDNNNNIKKKKKKFLASADEQGAKNRKGQSLEPIPFSFAPKYY
jgi:hypothetical protein